MVNLTAHLHIENPRGGEWVMRCGDNSTRYCCSAEDCCTRDNFLKIDLGVPDIIATAGVFSTTTGTSTTAVSSLVTSGESPTESPTETPTAAPSVTEDPSPAPSTGKSNGLAIGVGIGVGIGAIAILSAVAIWWFFRNRKKKTRLNLPEIDGYTDAKGEKAKGNALGESSPKRTLDTTIYELSSPPVELPDSTRVQLP